MIYIPHFCEEKFWGGKQVYIWTIVFYVELRTLKKKKVKFEEHEQCP